MNSGHSLSQGLRIQLGVNQVCSVGCATVVLPRLWFKPACEQNGAQIEPSDGLSLWLQLHVEARRMRVCGEPRIRASDHAQPGPDHGPR